LRDHRQIQALRDVLLLTPEDADLDDAFQEWTSSTLY
jgi:hypothetical protein